MEQQQYTVDFSQYYGKITVRAYPKSDPAKYSLIELGEVKECIEGRLNAGQFKLERPRGLKIDRIRFNERTI